MMGANAKLFLFSLVGGGSLHSGVELVHSKLFASDDRTLFNMNLSEPGKNERECVGIFRAIAVVLLENVPQLSIQIYYASVIEHGIGTVTGTSMTFAAMSICATVLGCISICCLKSASRLSSLSVGGSTATHVPENTAGRSGSVQMA